MKLEDKHVVITGGGTGIGKAIAHRLDGQGARITLMSRTQERLDEVASALRSGQGIAVDVSDKDSVDRGFAKAVDTFGPVAVLVNNAGIAGSAPFLKTTLQEWQKTIDVDLTGIFLCTQAALPGMLDAGKGRIISIASTAGLKGYAYVSPYCAAKHGVIGLTRSLAMETAKKGVTVNAVCPTFTDTEIVRTALRTIADKTGRSEEEAKADLVSVNPQRRLIDPDEVAAMVEWLCSDDARSVHGQALAIAGGEVM